MYDFTLRHFSELHQRYGGPLFVLNLIRQHEKKPREAILGQGLSHAMEALQARLEREQHPLAGGLRYVPFDFKRESKKKGVDVLQTLERVAEHIVHLTGFFCSTAHLAPPPLTPLPPASSDMSSQHARRRVSRPVFEPELQEDSPHEEGEESEGEEGEEGEDAPRLGNLRAARATSAGFGARAPGGQGGAARPADESVDVDAALLAHDDDSPRDLRRNGRRTVCRQAGIIRTNCIDCLDRTNIAQFCVGRALLKRQLRAIGLRASLDDGFDAPVGVSLPLEARPSPPARSSCT
jgi:hypothetical protein